MLANSQFKQIVWLISIALLAKQSLIGKNLGQQSSEIALLASLSPRAAVSASASLSPSVPNSVFSTILPQLKAKTRIPIRLPAYVPESQGDNHLYALLEVVNPQKYQIMLAFTPDCNGGTACRLGAVSGEKIMPQLTSLKGKHVPLAQGKTGYFLDAVCRANCSDATLTWEQDRSRFIVAIKAGKLETLIKMANSAIATRP